MWGSRVQLESGGWCFQTLRTKLPSPVRPHYQPADGPPVHPLYSFHSMSMLPLCNSSWHHQTPTVSSRFPLRLSWKENALTTSIQNKRHNKHFKGFTFTQFYNPPHVTPRLSVFKPGDQIVFGLSAMPKFNPGGEFCSCFCCCRLYSVCCILLVESLHHHRDGWETKCH